MDRVAARLRGGAAGGERGFALLVVLWSMALLALLGTHVVASGRAEILLASNLRGAAAAEAAADGAVHAAIFRLLDPSPRRWVPDGLPRELALPTGGIAEVRVESEQGKLNPNLARAEVLRSLLTQLGAEPRTAASLAVAILDWRSGSQRPRPGGAKEPQYRAAGRDYAPPGRPFQSIDELGLVLGMTPALLARLSPFLSIYQSGEPDPRFAHPLVLLAVREGGGDAEADAEFGGDTGGALVVAITVTASAAGGARFVRQAHVRLGAGTRGRPWQILDWRRLEG